MIGTRVALVRDTVILARYSAKEDKECFIYKKNQWRFPEWAWERATQDYLGRSIQQDDYWLKDLEYRPGAIFKGTSR